MKRLALRVTNAALTTILLLTVVICMPYPSGATAPDAMPVTSLSRCTTADKLPLQGRYAISAALGREQASYHIQRDGETLSLDETYTKSPPSYIYSSGVIPDGEYFVLGDNRNSSNDSHTGWTVPKDYIIGKVCLSIWPPSEWGTIPDFSLPP